MIIICKTSNFNQTSRLNNQKLPSHKQKYTLIANKQERQKLPNLQTRTKKPQTKEKCWKTELKDQMEGFKDLCIFSQNIPLSQINEKKTTS
jgi:hypothetical protein